MVVDLDPH
jgi:hypothetical protein